MKAALSNPRTPKVLGHSRPFLLNFGLFGLVSWRLATTHPSTVNISANSSQKCALERRSNTFRKALCQQLLPLTISKCVLYIKRKKILLLILAMIHSGVSLFKSTRVYPKVPHPRIVGYCVPFPPLPVSIKVSWPYYNSCSLEDMHTHTPNRGNGARFWHSVKHPHTVVYRCFIDKPALSCLISLPKSSRSC